MTKNYWQRHWKWIIPSTLLFLIIFLKSPIGNAVTDIAKVYADASVYENALDEVKANDTAIAILGTIAPIDKFAVVEGAVSYSNNNETVKITIRIKGSENKGKLDIIANKLNGDWVYELIQIRLKAPKKTIVIVD